jgi:hypothetical protein
MISSDDAESVEWISPGCKPGKHDDQQISTLKGLDRVVAAQVACHAPPVS